VRSNALLPIPVALALLATAGCSPDTPTEWPSKPVRVVVPFGAGTGTDLTARLFAPLLAERWGTPVVVDNRPGGDSVIGLQAFVAGADDHTLLFAPTGAVTLTPLQHESLGFNPDEDLVPIAAATEVTLAIAASRAVPISSLSDLVALARAHPGEYRWAAVPGLPELIFSAFLTLERLETTHVAYRDIPNALRDLGAGRIHVMIGSIATISPQLSSGNVRLLAVTTSERSAIAPQVPTAIEAGYPSLTIDGQWGFFGPRELPNDLRRRIAGDVRQATQDPTLVARLAAMGQIADGGTGEEFAVAIERQRQQVTEIARIVGLKEVEDVRVP
jgi:tripartite-type tricarboxylate transporter receptor subunit TctC